MYEKTKQCTPIEGPVVFHPFYLPYSRIGAMFIEISVDENYISYIARCTNSTLILTTCYLV